jgi:multidrug efflux pump subunit AcrA (membrane-fusion protein)
MKKKRAFVLASVLITALGAAAATGVFFLRAQEASALGDPRQEPPFVRLTAAAQVTGSERGFTGVIGARVQSNLGFRVPGKIVERLVNVGDQVKAGQPLMRIDETDLRPALTAKRNAVAAARASFVQLDADERRYAKLVSDGWVSRQRYDQAKAASDTAKAQLAAAEAEARVAENEATYSVLVADADGGLDDAARRFCGRSRNTSRPPQGCAGSGHSGRVAGRVGSACDRGSTPSGPGGRPSLQSPLHVKRWSRDSV